ALGLHHLDLNVRPAPVAGRFAGTASLLLGLDLVVAMPISWWPSISDYNRFARSPGEAAAGTSLGYVVANTSFYLIGAALVLLGIGGLFVPLLGVVIAETFVVRRSRYSPSDFFQAAPRWRWPAFASWFPGTALYFVIVWFGLPIGATLPSFALAAGLHVVFSKVEQVFARSTPLVSGGDP